MNFLYVMMLRVVRQMLLGLGYPCPTGVHVSVRFGYSVELFHFFWPKLKCVGILPMSECKGYDTGT